jgi:beta-lactamase regulating signal transducer with metallopeptidase domain
MPSFEILSSIALESILFGVVLGVGLVIAAELGMRLVAGNAATRALIWSVLLFLLPVLPALYFAGHIPIERHTASALIRRSRPQPIAVPEPAPITSVIPDAPTVAPRVQIPISRRLPRILFALYLVVAGIFLFRLLISYLRLRLLRHRTQAAPPELTARLRQWLSRCPTARPVELRLSHRTRSPLAIGFLKPMIIMPTGLVLELSQQEYDDLGVHELAHLRRYDDWITLAQRLLQAFLFFHPAAWYIARRLNLEREIACDDWVVAAHESKSYAHCLTKVVELRRYHRGGLLLSSGAFFGKRQIIRRVESLLDKRRNSATGISGVSVLCALLVLAGIASQVLHLPAVVAFTQDEAGANTSSRWVDDSRDLRIKLRGDVTFSPDEQSVASVSPGGFFIVDEAKGWAHRRLEVRSGENGIPAEKYFIDGREKPLDGVGRAWAASNYLFAMRELGLDSEARVTRLLTRGGPASVLEEVDRIHSDHVKSEYLSHLLEQAKLASQDLQRVTDSIRRISSDNDKADFLMAHQQELMTDQTRTSYFSAVNSIHSDNDRRRVLIHLLESDGHDPETARLIGFSARSMSSDNDKADVLLAIPAAASGDAGCGLLSAARTIQSDNDKARVLRDSGYVESAQCRDAWFAVANLIQSDNDRSEVLQNLLKSGNLKAGTYRNVADSVKAMNSDNDKANILTGLSGHYTGTSFFDAVDTIHSDNDRARVLKAVLETRPDKAVLLETIQTAVGINSDNDKADVLLEVARQSSEPEVKGALQKACEKFSSDNDYRRVASAIFNGPANSESSR